MAEIKKKVITKQVGKNPRLKDVDIAPKNRVAIIASGGKQYKVQLGQVIKVEKIAVKEGEKIILPDLLRQAKVTAEIVATKLDSKVTAVKFHKRKRYLHRLGHRQWQTILKITSIE